jgi:hypothetical protein
MGEDGSEDMEDENSEQQFNDKGDNDMEDAGSDYGGEYDQEVEEEEDAMTTLKKKGKKGDKDDIYAGYDDFAHLLENDNEKPDKSTKELTKKVEKKTFNDFEAAQHRFINKKTGNIPDTATLDSRRSAFEFRKEKIERKQNN